MEALRTELEEVRRELKRKPVATAGAVTDPEAVVSAVDGVNVVVQAVEGFDGDALLDLWTGSSSATARPRSYSVRLTRARLRWSRTSTQTSPNASARPT